MILGLETSCDETAAAVVTRKGEILANVVASQADLHARFGVSQACLRGEPDGRVGGTEEVVVAPLDDLEKKRSLKVRV